jgi:hypothetical protein
MDAEKSFNVVGNGVVLVATGVSILSESAEQFETLLLDRWCLLFGQPCSATLKVVTHCLKRGHYVVVKITSKVNQSRKTR